MWQDKTLIKIFEYALNQEETGKSFFQVSVKRMGVGAAVDAFKRLIKEEESHIRFINGILEELRKGDKLNIEAMKDVVLPPTNYFDQRAKQEFLDQCIEGSMVPDITVFNTAWLIEKDLSDFYKSMADKARGDAKEALLMLSRWEKGHEQFFKEYRDKLQEVYSKMPWGG